MRTLEADGKTLVKYCLNSSKFYHTYKFYKRLEKEDAANRLKSLVKELDYLVVKEFFRELELCYEAALISESDASPTQTFFQYVIDLIELYHSNEMFLLEAEELTDYPCAEPESFIISDDLLDDYERMLIYEYYIMGFDCAQIAKKKFSNTPNIHKKLLKSVAKLKD
jgi:hypothetical protein